MIPGAPRRALLLSLLLLAQVFALAATADHGPTPGQQAPDLRLISVSVDGVVRDPIQAPTALDTDDVRRYFVSSGQRVRTTLTIGNDGTASASGFYIELRDENGILIACPRVTETVAGGTLNFQYIMQWPVPVVENGDDDRRFTFRVNSKSGEQGCADSGGHLAEVAIPPGAGGSLVQTTPWEDNFGNVTLAVNRNPDLRIKVGFNSATPPAVDHTRTIAWCGGAKPADPQVTAHCFGNSVVGTDKDNVTAYARDATHFQVELRNGDGSRTQRDYWTKVYQANLTNLTLPGRQRVVGACDIGGWNACRVYVQFRVLEAASPGSSGTLDYHLDNNVSVWSGVNRVSLAAETRAVPSCGALVPGGTDCKNFDLDRKAGNYTITARVDPNFRYPDVVTTAGHPPENRTFTRPFQVRHVELGGNVSFHRLRQSMGAAWEVDADGLPILPTSGTLQFDAYVRNHGGPAAIAANRGGLPVEVKAYLLNPTGNPDVTEREVGIASYTLQPGEERQLVVNYPYSAVSGEGTYLRPGKVILRVIIDRTSLTDTTTGRYEEQCESAQTDTVGCDGWRNVIDAPFKIRDTVKPTIVTWGMSTGACVAADGSDCTIDPLTTAPNIRKKAPIQFTVVMTDDDASLDTASRIARLNLTVGGQRVPATGDNYFPAPGVRRTDNLNTVPNGHVKVAFTLKFPEGLQPAGAYQVQVDVMDSFGNRPAVAEPVRSLTISLYPISSIVVDHRLDCRGPDGIAPAGDTRAVCDAAKLWVHRPRMVFQYNPATPKVAWHIQVDSTQTGVPDANRAAPTAPDAVPVQKKFITILKPDGVTKWRDRILLTSAAVCVATHPVTGACTEWQKTNLYHHTEDTAISEFGLWRTIVEIEDAAGDVKKLYWNLTVHDADPILQILEPITAVDAGEHHSLKVEVVDEFAPTGVWANWTHEATGVFRNTSLTPVACQSETGVCRRYSLLSSTGIDANLSLGGKWKLVVAVKEGGGAFRFKTTTQELTVRDTRPPVILSAVATDNEEEFGFPFSWTVRATDETNWTAFLNVFKEDGSALTVTETDGSVTSWVNVPMGTRTGNKAEYTSSKLPLGRFFWSIRVEDSLGQPVTSQRTFLEIANNTAPRVTLSSPTLPTGQADTFWTALRPTITALVWDGNGIHRSSLRILVGPVGGTLADVTGSSWITATENPIGFRLLYNHTSSDPTDLEIRIDALDKSDPGNPKNQTFRLRVDSTAPQSSLGPDGISQPKYRASPNHVWNVTSQTVFTLTSLDPQGSGVARMEYRVNLDGHWTTASKSGFTISAVARMHTLYYRAIDNVGNVETEKFQRIWMDTEAPYFRDALPYFRVDDKYTNFTILDVGSGVQTASAWYKVNNAAYQELVLTYNDSQLMWVGKLPNLTHRDHLRIYATAKDFMGNVGAWGTPSNPPYDHPVGNNRPVISLLEPPGNSTVSGTVTIAWDVSDIDNDPVTITIFYRPEGATEWRYAAQNLTSKKGSYAFDTTTVVDGVYNFEIYAFDGDKSSQHRFTLTILNAQPAISQVKLNDPKPEIGRGLVLSAFVTKKDVEWVRANISRDGKRVVSNLALNDQGRDGDLVAGDRLFAATFTPDQPGSYDVEIVAKYRESGGTHQFAKGAKFSVQATSTWVVQDNPVLIAAIAAFGLGVVGLAAWGLTRRWA